jgi:hypothetical protein
MTYLLKIADSSGTVSVDMTQMNPNFVFQFSNPIITIPTPMDETNVIGPSATWNVVTMNLNMNTQNVQITFKETSGIGNLGSAVNFVTNPTTVFEKLLHLATDPTKKKLFINDDAAYFAYVEIEGYNATVSPGGKDFVEHSLNLVLSSSM